MGRPSDAAIRMLCFLESRQSFPDVSERGRHILGALGGMISFYLGRDDVPQIAEEIPSARMRCKLPTARSSWAHYLRTRTTTQATKAYI